MTKNLGTKKKVGVQLMLRRKLTAFLGTLALLVMLPMAASAVEISFLEAGNVNVDPSDIIILSHTLQLEVGENPNVFTWSLECTGCVVTHYTDYVSVPAYFPTAVDWTGNGTNDFADSLFSTDFLGPPASPQSTPGAIVGPVGTLKISGTFTGQGTQVVVGYVTVHITAASGSVEGFINPASDGFFCGAPLCTWSTTATFGTVTWVPEPGTAMLLALGLGGLGVMGRRGRS
jgi:hypothetical protein